MRLIFVFIIVLLISGCDLFFISHRKLDPATGKFDAYEKISKQEIVVDKNLNLKQHKQLLIVYVKSMYNIIGKNEEKFWIEAFKNMNFFDNVISTRQINNYINHNMESTVVDAHTHNVNKIRELMDGKSNYLIAEVYFEQQQGTAKTFIKMINPIDGKTYFMVDRHVKPFRFYDGFNEDGLFVYPMLNAVIDWANKNKGNN